MNCVRIAAAGDVHCREAIREQVMRAFSSLPGSADVLMLAGDLTTHGRPEEAIDCFLRTKMDVLVLGDHLIARNTGSSAS